VIARLIFTIAVTALLPLPASAESPRCAALNQTLAHERSLLQNNTAPLVSGSTLDATERAVRLTLQPFADALLLKEPERAPAATGGHAGYVAIAAPPPGVYRITIATDAWVDVIENSGFVRPIASEGARGCDGLRRRLSFRLSGSPVVVQFSGVASDHVVFALTRAPDPVSGQAPRP